MRNHLLSGLASSIALFACLPASAAVLTADTGWRNDTIRTMGAPSALSTWTFTISENGVLSVVDCCTGGDTYSLTGDFVGMTAFTGPGSAGDVQADGQGEFGAIYSANWLNGALSRAVFNVAPGTYSFSVTGTIVGGFPADFGIRLDTLGAVPEPATWAMMLLGFGFLGGAMRSAKRRQVLSVSFA